MSGADQRKQALRHDIMNVVKANGLPVTGELWFALAFSDESKLRQIAHELYIRADQTTAGGER